MSRYVAFLRGMNLGGRRVTNRELCDCFQAMGFTRPEAFLASGNVVFDAGGDGPATVAERVEEGLRSGLGYEVPTFLRTGEEVRAIAGHRPFSAAELAASAGKIQVALLATEPPAAAREAVLALATEADRLAVRGRELYWLPEGGISGSDLDLAAIDKALGPMTIRTRRTVERIAGRYFAG